MKNNFMLVKTTKIPFLLRIEKKKLFSNKLILALILVFSTVIIRAATITSTPTGGNWATGSTWVGGFVPAVGDAVIIATTGSGSVNIAATVTQTNVGSVTINNGAILTMTAGTVTFGALTVNINGILIVKQSTTILGATNISGRINFGSSVTTKRTINFNGAVALNTGAIWDETNAGANTIANAYVIKNSFVNNATTFIPLAASVHTFSGSGTLSGSTTFFLPRATFIGTYTNNGTLTSGTLLTVTTVALTNNGTITANTSLAGTGALTQGSTGVLNLGKTSAIVTLSATASGNIVNYNGAAQTVHAGNYSTLNLSGSGAKTLTTGTAIIESLTLSGTATSTTVANLGITNNLTVGSGTTFTTGSTFTLGVGGATSITGSLVLGGTAAKTFTGNVMLNSGAVWNESGVATIDFGGSFANNASTFSANTGAHNFNGGSKIISGTTATNIPTATFTGAYSINSVFSAVTSLTVAGAVITNNAAVTATNALTGSGTLLQGANSLLNIGGAIGIASLDATALGNTVNYTGASQTGFITTYNNLTVSGSGNKTFATSPSVNAVLSMEGTATLLVTTGTISYGPNATLQFNTNTPRTASNSVWITPFTAGGGIIIKNTGAITTPGIVQIGNDTSVPLNINAGSTLTPGANLITFHGDFINNGTVTNGSGGISIGGTTATQSVGAFTTTGPVTLAKTAGTATTSGNINGGALTINGPGGTLNLGIGMTHTFTGIVTLTEGILNGGGSTLNQNAVSATAWSGTGNVFVPATGTVNFGGFGNQDIAANSVFYNVGFLGSGTKTFNNATTINNNFSISGTAVANLSSGFSHTANSLSLGGVSQSAGSWGSSASSAVNKNATWFGSSATGTTNINCTAPVPPISGGNNTICAGVTIPALTVTVTGESVADWYNQSSGGTLLLSNSTSYTPTAAGTFYAETRTTASGCLSATRTGVTLNINPKPILLSLTPNTICSSPGGNGTISSSTSQNGVNYQLYNASNATVQALKPGTGAALIWSTLPAGNGYYVVETNATTGCSTTTDALNIVANPNPTPLILSGSTICSNPGGDGTITATTSQVGTGYQLYDSGNIAVQSTISGTGGAIAWTFLDAGTGYYVTGTNLSTGCTSSNSNIVNVSTFPSPIALVLAGSTICASPGGNGSITSSTSVTGVNYQLNDSLGRDIGVALPGTGSALTFSGIPAGTGYFVDAVRGETGCASPSSSSVDILTSANPGNKTITVSPASVCTGTGANIIVAGSLATESYQLRNNSGNTFIGSAVTGNGGALNLPTGNLTDTTTFNVLATITATGCTTTMTTTPTVTVNSNNTPGTASSTPTLCINTVLTNITHTTTGATGISGANGLPAGVSASWLANVITISGTPSASGIFNYSIPLTGGCASVNATGTITVTVNNTTGPASSNPTLCINTPLINITHATTGATGISSSGISGANALPAGVSAIWASNTVTISGTPTSSGTFNYSIPLTGGCPSVNATGTITVTANNAAGIPSSTPTLCINATLQNITIVTTGATGITGSGISGANGLPAGVSASWALNTVTISGIPSVTGTFNYSIPLTGGCGSVNATGKITVTGASSTAGNQYISNVQFLGTLNRDTNNVSLYTSPGYSNFTLLAEKAKQIPGGVINVNVNLKATSGASASAIKGWVDWNKDGVYNDDASENVYDLGAFKSENVIFGFVIPDGTAPGIYTIRIRSNDGTSGFGPCGILANGETEDYSFEIIEDCTAKILSVKASQQCGAGPATLTATYTGGTSYKWYETQFGSTAIAGETTNTYTTPSLNVGEPKTYYVTAFDGLCESTYRTPIKITVRPAPIIKFTTSSPEICGELNQLIITSSGDKEQVALLEDNFENTVDKPLKFKNVSEGDLTEEGKWTVQLSPYLPPSPHLFRPALSSGYSGGKFANIITDLRYAVPLRNSLESIAALNSTGVTDLKMDFDFYYFSEEDSPGRNNLKVQYSIQEDVWKDVDGQVYFTDQGSPSKFKSVTIDLPKESEDKINLKVRFLLSTFASSAEWIANIVAIDNVRVYGDKDLPAKFTWSGEAGIIYSSETCSGNPDPLGSPSVCIKVGDPDLKSKSQFMITATAALSNGCNASGNIIIKNNTKIWDATATTDWNTTNWQPADSKLPPVADKCVIIRTPVVLNIGSEGFARNVKIEAGGKLTIKKDQALTVTDAFINGVPANDVLIESDGNLIQTNEGTNINTGSITAKRDVNLSGGRQQYNYIISPLEGQSLASIYKDGSGNTVTVPFVLYHNEATNKFYTSSGAYIKGRGLTMKEPAATFTPTTMNTTFQGKPTNGAFTYGIVKSGAVGDTNRGYNLIGNPYPSNIDLVKFFSENNGTGGNLESTFYFWDNKANNKTAQEGDLYGGQSYGIFNAATPVGAGTGLPGTGDFGSTKIPTRYVKTGQAFMVKSKVASATVIFNNTIRTKSGTTGFFGKSTENTNDPVDRYWLSMISPANIASNIAVVYFQEGHNAFAQDDSRSMGGSDAIYSMVENEKVSINGRSNFLNTDIIPLGSQHFAAGNYTITLGDKEGIFAEGQNIYLKDKQTGIISNLNTGDYLFYANAGESTGRFEIIYVPETVLATDGTVKENLIVYRNGSDFVIKAKNEKITALDVFDGAGRLMMSSQPNSVEIVLPASQLVKGFYILKINQNGRISSKKIIK